MARRPRQSSEQVEATMLKAMSSYINNSDAASDICFPSFDKFIWDKSIPESDQPARSALYKLWPSREDALDALVKYMLKSDLYNAAYISEKHKEIVTEAPSSIETTTKNSLILAMGLVAVKSTNHVIASRIENAAEFRMHETLELKDVLQDSRDKYVQALADGYESFHAKVGDTLSDGHDFIDYARVVANTARGVALNPFSVDVATQNIQAYQFIPIAEKFTQPA